MHLFNLPAELAVRVLEARSQDVADVGHVEQHQGDPDEGVDDGEQLPQVGLGGQVAVTWNHSIFNHLREVILVAFYRVKLNGHQGVKLLSCHYIVRACPFHV